VKRKFGDKIRTRKFRNQGKEIKFKLIVYNINKKVVEIICVKLRLSTEPIIYILINIIGLMEMNDANLSPYGS